jgi:signal transduction histidine kinase
MNDTQTIATDLDQSYSRALCTYLQTGGEAPLLDAYELGRKGLTEGLGVLDMVDLHHSALAGVIREKCADLLSEVAVLRAGEFFSECMSSYEMAFRAIGDANAALRKLNKTLEEEVRRIALALHDDAGQLMVAAHLSLDEVSRDLPPATQARLKKVKELLIKVDDRIRHLSHELHPAMLEHLGLIPALEFLAENVAKRTGLRITIKSTLHHHLPPALATIFYRIVQESLTNVQRHACASTVAIRIRKEGDILRCAVIDNGIGFTPSQIMRSGPQGLGLLGIQERLNSVGGQLHIQSAKGHGTKLEFSAPLMESENADNSLAR